MDSRTKYIRGSDYNELRKKMYDTYQKESDKDNVFYVQMKNTNTDNMISWFETRDGIVYWGKLIEKEV